MKPKEPKSDKEHPSRRILTLANQITILRIVLIPVIVVGLLTSESPLVVGLLLFSMLTDLLDGLVARKRGEHTELGAFLDPMADKLLMTALFLTLTYQRSIPIWVFVIIFSRDLLIVLGWGIIYILTGSSKITVRALGKITTAVQMTTAFVHIVAFPPALQHTLLWLTIILTIVSAVEYIVVAEKRLGQWA